MKMEIKEGNILLEMEIKTGKNFVNFMETIALLRINSGCLDEGEVWLIYNKMKLLLKGK